MDTTPATKKLDTLSRLFIQRRSDIIKFVVVLFLWMYAVLTIFPVEQFIMRTNIRLSQRPESRIRLFEMTMLSPNVLSLVERYQSQSVLKEPVGYLEREGEEKSQEDFDWTPWIERQRQRLADNKWYENNLKIWTKEYFFSIFLVAFTIALNMI
ncbi:MAG: hypothetical protein Q8Q23_01805 [bacterium]|nr:hypothetical protein [bacterium]